MLLSSLELIGFKSFVQRTKLQFHPGITGIVGPNGCGKSNLVDAIRWVMGELRGSVLRSERMVQIIFSGTKTRKPLGMAEVSLTFENNRSLLPTEYSEVTLTRRLYRDSQSEYLLNRNRCRLKDFIDLFMDTGLGADSYGIIELGMLNRVLTDDPLERRALFEEAAGIAKYKMRVHTARRKLESVNENLDRITDILTEVERNVRSLKRQYNQAKAYESLRGRIEELEAMILALDRTQLLEQLSQLNEKKGILNRSLGESEADRTKLEKNIEHLASKINRGEAEIADTRAEWEKYQSEAFKAENRLLLIDEKERGASGERERSIEDIERSRQRISFLDQRIGEHRSSLKELENDIAGISERVDAAHQGFSNAERDMRQLRISFGQADERVNRLRNEAADLEKEITARRVRITSLEERKKSLSEESLQIKSKLDELIEMKSQALENKYSAEANLKEVENEAGELEQKTGVLKTGLEKAEKRKSKLQIRFEQLKSEQQFLHSLIEKKGGLPDGVTHLLETRRKGIVESVGNIIGVKPEYTTAIETALGDMAGCLIAETFEDGVSAIESLREDAGGRATIVPLDSNLEFVPAEAVSIDGVIDTADKLVECEPLFQKLVTTLLGSALVVETWEDALKAHRAGEWKGIIVTLNGESVGAIGISGGTTEAKYPTVGRTKRLAEAAKALQDITGQIDGLETEIDSIAVELSDLEDKLTEAADRRNQSTGEISLFAEKIAAFIAEESALLNRSQNIEEECERIAREQSSAEAQLIGLIGRLKSSQAQLAELESGLGEKRTQLRELTTVTEREREEFHRRQLKLTSRRGEMDKLKSEIILAQSRRSEIEDEITRLEKNIENIDSRLQSMKEERGNFLTQIEEYKRLRDEWLKKLQSLVSTHRTLKEERTSLSGKLKQISSVSENLKTKLSILDVQSAEINSKIASKEDIALDQFGVDLQAVELPDAADRTTLENELNKLKRKITSIGPVNLLALQEYDKARERLNFLKLEHQDIIESKEGLLETITKTNTEARARFRKVFAEVAEYFRLLFADLFDGGEGEISPSSDDPLEAEILIRANPAGKKLMHLNQLSGGEKAMTALALIFALYQVKPSPFCILDEVDAPLDDANVERFLKLLRRFVPETQFILITHNKMTMEACNFLYGVTMEEEGLSKIVSVELSKLPDGLV